MSNRLEELYEKMVDEAPFIFPESNRGYVLELAKIYAHECCKASLEKAFTESLFDWNTVSKKYADEYRKSIVQESNIVIL